MKEKKSENGLSRYLILNRIFGLILISVILYSIIIPPERRHPIPSGSIVFSDKPTISTGLSRSFSAAVRMNFEAAKSYNQFGIRVFLFFIIQLLLRAAGLLIAVRVPERVLKLVVLTDILLSIFLFLYSFWPFLIAIFTNVSNL